MNGPNERMKTDVPATANTSSRCKQNEVSTGVPPAHSQHQQPLQAE